jgi:GNAT superfamily N-acetyltransferase
VRDHHRSQAGPLDQPEGFRVVDNRPSDISGVCHAVRRATPEDAAAISALYVRIYTPAGGGDARDYYPFPQIMSPDRVASMIAGDDFVWLVGDAPDGGLVGSAAAKRNIGDARDRIAEVFGVAVDPARRHGGLGSALVGGLIDELADGWEFILCEARTDDAGGWKVARNAGFVPVGYEPYAHSMPVGFESMVLTGRRRRSSPADRLDGEAPWQARRLQEAVMGLAPGPAGPHSAQREREQEAPPPKSRVNVRRDDVAGWRWFGDPAGTFDRSSGVVGLNPLQGQDHSGRFTEACYIASSESSEVGAARVFYDRVDARARVLGLRTAVPQVRAALLAYLVDDLRRLAGDNRLVIIALIGSTCSDAQRDLIELGFFPTVYLPAFVAAPAGRSDVVQYTLLTGCSLRESTDAVTAKQWPEAERIITQVLCFAQ